MGKDWKQGNLEHGKELCSSSSPTRCSRTKPADKNEKNREKKKLRKPGCHKPTPLRKILSSRFGCSGNHCKLTVLRKLVASRTYSYCILFHGSIQYIFAERVYSTRFTILTERFPLKHHILPC